MRGNYFNFGFASLGSILFLLIGCSLPVAKLTQIELTKTHTIPTITMSPSQTEIKIIPTPTYFTSGIDDIIQKTLEAQHPPTHTRLYNDVDVLTATPADIDGEKVGFYVQIIQDNTFIPFQEKTTKKNGGTSADRWNSTFPVTTGVAHLKYKPFTWRFVTSSGNFYFNLSFSDAFQKITMSKDFFKPFLQADRSDGQAFVAYNYHGYLLIDETRFNILDFSTSSEGFSCWSRVIDFNTGFFSPYYMERDVVSFGRITDHEVLSIIPTPGISSVIYRPAEIKNLVRTESIPIEELSSWGNILHISIYNNDFNRMASSAVANIDLVFDS
jgi:hypothetical protein